jgi:hypothetical protein
MFWLLMPHVIFNSQTFNQNTEMFIYKAIYMFSYLWPAYNKLTKNILKGIQYSRRSFIQTAGTWSKEDILARKVW